MKRYNPYKSAFSAAISELTSDRALNYYEIRAWQDAQAIVDAAVAAGTATYQAAMMAYQMGAFCRAWLLATEQAAIEITAIVPVEFQSGEIVILENDFEDFIDAEIIEEPLLLAAFTEIVTYAEAAIAFASQIREAVEMAIQREFYTVPVLIPVYCAGYLEPVKPQPKTVVKKTKKVKAAEDPDFNPQQKTKKQPRKTTSQLISELYERQDNASIAPQKSATLARVVNHAAHID